MLVTVLGCSAFAFGGDWKWAPVVADIDPHPGMEIIVSNGTSLESGYWRGQSWSLAMAMSCFSH